MRKRGRERKEEKERRKREKGKREDHIITVPVLTAEFTPSNFSYVYFNLINFISFPADKIASCLHEKWLHFFIMPFGIFV
jgi:hypothetical protein